MANTFSLKIVTPSHDVYNGDIEKIFLKNSYGEFEVLSNHEDMIASIIPAIVKFIDAEGVSKELFISTATVQVTNNSMVICSDAAEFEDDIDVERALKSKQRAEDRLREVDEYDKARLEVALLRAKQRLKLKKA